MNESSKAVARNLFVIFGGTGDLSKRKLLPAIARAQQAGHLHEGCHILAISRSSRFDDSSFRDLMAAELSRASIPAEQAQAVCQRLHFHTAPDNDFSGLRQRIEALEADHELPQNRVFYLALPQSAFLATAEALYAVGLHQSAGWTRVVVEKPFGHDYASAKALDDGLHAYFDESQLYRIDHYLGKDTVQNLLVMRFANPIFEMLWNRERIEAVQITVAESLGVESRAAYYDQSGALRDMVQNHMFQLLSLIAMEMPATYIPAAIRYEKIKVLNTLAPLRREDVVLAQYSSALQDDTEVKGYREEDGVAPDSPTDTFVAMQCFIENWRWKGVPFYLRTGKRLPRRTTQIAVKFRDAPVCLFESLGACPLHSNILLITLQPDEGFALHFDVKQPGSHFSTRRIPLQFNYREAFEAIPDAYETLIVDIMSGDQTLFVHSDEVLASWAYFDDLLQNRPAPVSYPAGSWGPPAAQHLRVVDPILWQHEHGK